MSRISIFFKRDGNEVLATNGGRIIGRLKFYHPGDTSGRRNVFIDDLRVSSKYRRQGIATKMLQLLIKKFKKRCVWLTLWTGEVMEKDKSWGLYEKVGFSQVGYFADYYKKGIGVRFFAIRGEKDLG